MACIEKIYSVSALVGDGRCNGNCEFCSAKNLREQARKSSNDPLYWKNYESAIKLSARHGGWSLSLTSSGEPTCDPEAVTKALETYSDCAVQGAWFPNVNLFSNGILLADPKFCHEWLPYWRSLGLTNIAISIHSVDRERQARAYGIPNYHSFNAIFANINNHGIGVR